MAWKMSKANLTSGETGAYIEIPAVTVGNGTTDPTVPIELQKLYEKVQDRPKLYSEKNKIPAGAGNGSGNGGGDSLNWSDYIQDPGVVKRFEANTGQEWKYAGGGITYLPDADLSDITEITGFRLTPTSTSCFEFDGYTAELSINIATM